MTVGLRKLVQQLSVFLSEQNEHSVLSVLETIKDVVLSDAQHADLYSSVLLSSDAHSLLTLLSTVKKTKIPKAIAQVIYFLREYIQNIHYEEKYNFLLLKTLPKLFRANIDNPIRIAAFTVFLECLSHVKSESDIDFGSLFDDFLSDLQSRSKLGLGLSGMYFFALGRVCRLAGDALHEKAVLLQKYYASELEKQKRKPQFPVIKGVFEGINEFLFNFHTLYTSNSKDSELVYSHIRIGASIGISENKPTFLIATLEILKNHSQVFNRELFRDVQFWTDLLLQLCGHSNQKLKTTAMETLEEVVFQVSAVLNAQDKAHSTVFNRLIKRFSGIIHSSEEGLAGYSLLASIRSISLLAKNLLEFTDSAQYLRFLRYIITHIERLTENSLLNHQTSYFVSSIAQLLAFVPLGKCIFPYEFVLLFLQKLISKTFVAYASMLSVHRRRVSIALLQLFGVIHRISAETAYFNGFLESVSYAECIAMLSPGRESAVFESVGIWKVLLEIPVESRFLFGVGLEKKDLEKVQCRTYHFLVESMARIIAQLDLKGSVEESADSLLFGNCVVFCSELFGKCRTELFLSDLFVFCKVLVEKFSEFPKEFRLLKCLSVANRILNEFPNAEIVCEVTELLTEFSETIISNISYLENELLTETVNFLLTLPTHIITLEQLFPVIDRSLHLGTSDPFIAEIAFECIENHTKQSKVRSDSQTLSNIVSQLVKFIQIPKSTEERQNVHRILQLIGSLSHTSANFLSPDEENEILLRWDPFDRIQFPIPFPDVVLQTSLDNLLPHLLKLAQFSPQRYVKIAACESLHSILILMVATNARNPQIRKDRHTAMHLLYEKIFPVALRLAVDSDKVTRQLFHTLMLQLVHWFTKNVAREEKELLVVLDAVMEGLCHSSNAELRSFCGECVAEYLLWTVRQSVEPVPEVALFWRRIFNHLRHSNHLKRLGGWISLKFVYRTLREFDSVLAVSLLGILKECVQSLNVENKYLQKNEIVEFVMEKLIFILTNPKHPKVALFIESDETRIGDEHCRSVHTFLEWALGEVFSVQHQKRSVAMRLHDELVPIVYGTTVFEFTKSKEAMFLPKFARLCEDCSLDSDNAMLRFLCALHCAVWVGKYEFIAEYAGKLVQLSVRYVSEEMYDTETIAKSERKITFHQNLCSQILLFVDAFVSDFPRRKFHGNEFVKRLISLFIHPQKLHFSLLLPKQTVQFQKTVFRVLCKLKCEPFDLSEFLDLRMFKDLEAPVKEIPIVFYAIRQLNKFKLLKNFNALEIAATCYSKLCEKRPISSHSENDKFAMKLIVSICPRTNDVVELLFSSSYAVYERFKRVIIEYFAQRLGELSMQWETALRLQNWEENVLRRQILKDLLEFSRKEILKSQALRFLDVQLQENLRGITKIVSTAITNGFHRLLSDAEWEMRESIHLYLLSVLEELAVALQNSQCLLENSDVLQYISSGLRAKTAIFSAHCKLRSLAILKAILMFNSEMTFPTELLESLSSMSAQSPFPLRSTDLKKGSVEWSTYISALKAILDLCSVFPACDLLYVFFPLFSEEKHAFASGIETFCKEFIVFLAGKHTKSLSFCDEVLSGFYSDSDSNEHLKKEKFSFWCLQNILSELLDLIPSLNLKTLYQKHWRGLWETIQTCAKNPQNDTESEVEKLIFSFDVLRVFVARLNFSELFISEELTVPHKVICQRAHAVFMKNSRKTEKSLGLTASAYAFLAEMLFAMDCKEKFFTGFLFTENERKGEILWRNLINVRERNLALTIDTFFKMKTNVHSAMAQTHSSPQYISSQYLQQSSLQSQLSIASFRMTWETSEENSLSEEESAVSEELELDTFNRNPIMPVLLRLIDRLYDKFGAEWTAGMPTYMKLLKNAFVSTLSDGTATESEANSEQNVIRWFIVKVIVSRQEHFATHALEWLPLLIDHLVSPLNEGQGFHYLLRDVCFVLIEWNVFAEVNVNSLQNRHEIIDKSSKFIEFLMSNATDFGGADGKEAKLKSNVSVIKQLVEQWKGFIHVRKKVILQLFNVPGDRRSDRTLLVIAVSLLGVLAANGIPLYSSEIDRDIPVDKYFDLLFTFLRNRYKNVFESVAELFGMIFHMSVTEPTLLMGSQNHKNVICAYLTELFVNRDYTRFIGISAKISLHCADFLTNDLRIKLFQVVGAVETEVQSDGLQVVLRMVDYMADTDLLQCLVPILSEIVSGNITHIESLRYALLILLSVLKRFEWGVLKQSIVAVAQGVHAHSDDAVRATCYKILVWVMENRLQEKPDVQHDTCARSVTEYLLIGLSDASGEIREMLYNHWNNRFSAVGEDSVSERLVACFDILYSPVTEGAWLSYCLFLLLETSTKSPVYISAISPQPIGECAFTPMEVDSVWHSQSPQVTEQGRLLASQAPQFSMTQSIIDMDPQSQSVNEFMGSIASFTGQSVMYGQTTTPASQSFNIRPVSPEKKLRTSARNFRVRFGTQKTREIAGKAMRSLDIKKRYENIWKEQKANEERMSARVYREYRAGDLPDIEIAYKDIILPLKALHKDPIISRRLFLSIVRSVLKESCAEYVQRLLGAMLHVLQSVTSEYSQQTRQSLKTKVSAHFVAVLLNCVLLCQRSLGAYQILPELSLIAQETYTPEMATLVLEANLSSLNESAAKSNATKEAKKRKVVSLEKSLMIGELSLVYRQIQETQLLYSLFAQNSTQTFTREALCAVTNNDYLTALSYYESALDVLDQSLDLDAFPKFETDLWEDQRLECLEKLGRWDVLYDNVCAETSGKVTDLWDKSRFDSVTVQKSLIRSFLSSGVSSGHLNEVREFIGFALENKLPMTDFSDFVLQYHLDSGDLAMCEFYLSECLDWVTSEWVSVSDTAIFRKQTLLKRMQKFVEFKEILEVLKGKTEDANVLKVWKQRELHGDVSEILRNRIGFIEKMGRNEETEEFLLDLLAFGGDRSFELRNFEISTFYYRKALTIRDSESVYIKALRSEFFNEKAAASLQKLSGRSELIAFVDQFSRINSPAALEAACECLESMFENEISQDILSSEADQEITRILYESYKALSSGADRADTLYKFTKFIDERILRFCRGSDSGDSESESLLIEKRKYFGAIEFEETDTFTVACRVVRNYLQCIAEGYPVAYDRFPRVLHLMEFWGNHPEFAQLHEIYSAAVDRIPSWVFIRWISQLIAVLINHDEMDQRLSVAYAPLEKLRVAYPQALFYPFHCSTSGVESRLVERLRSDMQSVQELRNVERIVDSLSDFDLPVQKFQDWEKETRDAIDEKNSEAVLRVWKHLVELSIERTELGFQSFWRLRKAKFVSAFGKDGKKLVSFCSMKDGSKSFATALEKLDIGIQKEDMAVGTAKLEDFSRYLYSFEHDIDVRKLKYRLLIL